MTYELKQTQLKNGKFHYQVIDENGNVISERKSNREYVACTINGGTYWGRLDLVGKGDYKRVLDWAIKKMNMSEADFNKRFNNDSCYTWTYDEMVQDGKKDYEALTKIAYKK